MADEPTPAKGQRRVPYKAERLAPRKTLKASKEFIMLAPRKSLLFNVEAHPDHPPTTYMESLIHLLKGNIGMGIFAMGDAFMNAGIVVAPILTLFIAIICLHCEQLLVRCSEQMRQMRAEEVCPDYADTVELCFENGPKRYIRCAGAMRLLTNYFICFAQLGFCCVYLVFIATSLSQIGEAFDYFIPVRWMLVIIMPPILLACLITNLKWLTPVSGFSILCMFVGLLITLLLGVMDGLPSPSVRNAYTTPNQLPLYFGTVIFAFEGIALVLPLRNAMYKPWTFEEPCGVLNVGIFIVTMLYEITGFIGYLRWGEETAGSLTLNLGHSMLDTGVKGMVAIGILLTYPLQFFIAAQIMWPSVMKAFHLENHQFSGELLFRSFMVLVTLIIAELVPALNLFISLIGAVCSTFLALVFPPILELMIRTCNSKFEVFWIFFKNILIIIFALVGFSTGTYETLKGLYFHFKNN